jgi:hypothetical protein
VDPHAEHSSLRDPFYVKCTKCTHDEEVSLRPPDRKYSLDVDEIRSTLSIVRWYALISHAGHLTREWTWGSFPCQAPRSPTAHAVTDGFAESKGDENLRIFWAKIWKLSGWLIMMGWDYVSELQPPTVLLFIPPGDMWAWIAMTMMPAGDNSCPVHQSSLAVLPAETSGESRRNGRKSENFAYKYLKYLKKVKSKAVPLHAMEALGGRGGIAPTHSRPRH